MDSISAPARCVRTPLEALGTPSRLKGWAAVPIRRPTGREAAISFPDGEKTAMRTPPRSRIARMGSRYRTRRDCWSWTLLVAIVAVLTLTGTMGYALAAEDAARALRPMSTTSHTAFEGGAPTRGWSGGATEFALPVITVGRSCQGTGASEDAAHEACAAGTGAQAKRVGTTTVPPYTANEDARPEENTGCSTNDEYKEPVLQANNHTTNNMPTTSPSTSTSCTATTASYDELNCGADGDVAGPAPADYVPQDKTPRPGICFPYHVHQVASPLPGSCYAPREPGRPFKAGAVPGGPPRLARERASTSAAQSSALYAPGMGRRARRWTGWVFNETTIDPMTSAELDQITSQNNNHTTNNMPTTTCTTRSTCSSLEPTASPCPDGRARTRPKTPSAPSSSFIASGKMGQGQDIWISVKAMSPDCCYEHEYDHETPGRRRMPTQALPHSGEPTTTCTTRSTCSSLEPTASPCPDGRARTRPKTPSAPSSSFIASGKMGQGQDIWISVKAMSPDCCYEHEYDHETPGRRMPTQALPHSGDMAGEDEARARGEAVGAEPARRMRAEAHSVKAGKSWPAIWPGAEKPARRMRASPGLQDGWAPKPARQMRASPGLQDGWAPKACTANAARSRAVRCPGAEARSAKAGAEGARAADAGPKAGKEEARACEEEAGGEARPAQNGLCDEAGEVEARACEFWEFAGANACSAGEARHEAGEVEARACEFWEFAGANACSAGGARHEAGEVEARACRFWELAGANACSAGGARHEAGEVEVRVCKFWELAGANACSAGGARHEAGEVGARAREDFLAGAKVHPAGEVCTRWVRRGSTIVARVARSPRRTRPTMVCAKGRAGGPCSRGEASSSGSGGGGLSPGHGAHVLCDRTLKG